MVQDVAARLFGSLFLPLLAGLFFLFLYYMRHVLELRELGIPAPGVIEFRRRSPFILVIAVLILCLIMTAPYVLNFIFSGEVLFMMLAGLWT